MSSADKSHRILGVALCAAIPLLLAAAISAWFAVFDLESRTSFRAPVTTVRSAPAGGDSKPTPSSAGAHFLTRWPESGR